MGIIDELLLDIKNQFISFYDSLLFVVEHDNTDTQTALKFLKTKLLDGEQIYLMLIDDMRLQEVRLFADDYSIDDDFDGLYITKTTIINELNQSINNSVATDTASQYGFGLKKFVSTCQKLGMSIPYDIIVNMCSPDCYHDQENPLTPIVQELQAENKALKQQKSPHNQIIADLQAQNEKLTQKETETAKRLKEIEQQVARLQAYANNQDLPDNTEQSYLATIGLLLELCQKKSFSSQNQIITAIIEYDIQGQGQRTLQDRFAKANQTLIQAMKK